MLFKELLKASACRRNLQQSARCLPLVRNFGIGMPIAYQGINKKTTERAALATLRYRKGYAVK
jgi:hypothetical protein